MQFWKWRSSDSTPNMTKLFKRWLTLSASWGYGAKGRRLPAQRQRRQPPLRNPSASWAAPARGRSVPRSRSDGLRSTQRPMAGNPQSRVRRSQRERCHRQSRRGWWRIWLKREPPKPKNGQLINSTRDVERPRVVATDIGGYRSADGALCRLTMRRHRRPPSFRLWEGRDLGCDARVARRCTTRVVDDVVDLAVIAQANRDHAVEPDVRAAGNFDGPAQRHAAIPEHAVDSEPPGFVAGNILRHFVRSPSIRSRRACVARLVRRLLRNLGLIEVYAPTVTVPEDLEFLVMLDEQAVDGDIVSIHNQPVRAGIALPAHSGAMVRPPDPRVIHDRVAAVDPQVSRRAAHRGAAHPKKNVME